MKTLFDFKAEELYRDHFSILLMVSNVDEETASVLAKSHAIATVNHLITNSISNLSGQERNPYSREYWESIKHILLKM